MEITWKEIAHGFASQAHFCEGYSDLYFALFTALAEISASRRDDLPLTPPYQAFIDLIEMCWQERPIESWIEATLLTAGALHAAILDSDPAADGLRPFYATVGGQFDLAQDTPAFHAELEKFWQQPGEIAPWFLEEARVQTNEVSRGIGWMLPAYIFSAWQPDLAITFVDLGTSAGLNLAADFQNWEWIMGNHPYTVNNPPRLMTQYIHQEDPADPGLRIFYPDTPLPPLNIVQRVGFDQNPLNINNPADQLSLRALIWGDQPDRLHRLEQAFAGYEQMQAAIGTPRFFQGDLLDAAPLLPNLITDDMPRPHLLLIFNSAVTTYLNSTVYDKLRANIITALNQLPDGVKGLWLELEPPRHNEEVERDKHFLLKARVPFMGGISSFYLGELEAHPVNFYLRPGWDTLREMLGY